MSADPDDTILFTVTEGPYRLTGVPGDCYSATVANEQDRVRFSVPATISDATGPLAHLIGVSSFICCFGLERFQVDLLIPRDGAVLTPGDSYIWSSAAAADQPDQPAEAAETRS